MSKAIAGQPLAPRKRVWFYADELAACDVTFPAGSWNIAYWVKALDSGEKGEGRVYTRGCYVDSTGSYKRVSSISISAGITDPTHIEEIVEILGF